MSDNLINMQEYSSEYQASVEERLKRPPIDIKTVEREENGERKSVNIIDIAGVPIESLATREDIQQTIKEIYPTKDTLELLQAMAICFQQKRGLIAEGRTSRGKTYIFNKFAQLIFGREALPVDFYVNGQTDTMSLMAKWVPKTDNPEDTKRWQVWAQGEEGQKAFQEIIDLAKGGTAHAKDIEERFTALAKMAGISNTVLGWELQLGALPKAMVMPPLPTKPISEDNPARGTFLHIQEVGLAETQVIDALLQLGGEKGKLSTQIQLWDDGGRIIKGGPNFWIYYSTNVPEDYPNRQAIDQALARRNTYFNLGAEPPVSRMLRQYMDNNIPYSDLPEALQGQIEASQKEVIFPIQDGENSYNTAEFIPTRLVVTDTVADFHERLMVAMAGKMIEQRTKQRFEITDDEWNMVYDFMRRFATDDIEATLDRAIMLHYISRFTDKGRGEAWRLWGQVKTQKNFRERIETSMKKTYVGEGGENFDYFERPFTTTEGAKILPGTLVEFLGKKSKYIGIDAETKKPRFILLP